MDKNEFQNPGPAPADPANEPANPVVAPADPADEPATPPGGGAGPGDVGDQIDSQAGDQSRAQAGDPPKVSVWEMMYGALFSPVHAMAQIADARPVGTALLINIGLYVFALVIGLLTQTPAADLGELPPGVPRELAEVIRGMLPAILTMASIMGGVLSIIVWFVRAAVYQLLGQLMGGTGDGHAMLAALGFAALPNVFLPPVRLVAGLLNLGFLSTIASIGVWIWSVILAVMAIRGALRTSTGRAVGIYLIPWAALVAIVILFFIALGTVLVPLIQNMPKLSLPNLP